MDTLTTAQKTAVTKSSTDRLRLLLMRYGYAEDAVLAWSREELMNKYAELLAQGVEPPTTRAVDTEAEKERMAHEKEMKQMEMQLEQQRIEQQKLEQHRHLEELQLEKQKLILQERLEMEKLALERERLKTETGLKTAELENKERAENDVTKLLKRYGDALAQVISSQPEEVTDLPAYFRGVETQFEKLKIPLDYRARLIYKYLSPRARALCSRLDADVRNDYQKVKDAVMKEYGLTAKCFLTKFNTVRKGSKDTYILFASKLDGLLRQYLEARKVTEFNSLVSLLISDRIKSALSDQCLRYVLSVENNQTSTDTAQWLKPSRLAELVDEYIATVGRGSGPDGAASASYIGQPQPPAEGSHQEGGRGSGGSAGANSGNAPPAKANARNDHWNNSNSARPVKNSFGRKCSICGSPYHLRATCDKRVGSSVRVNNTAAVGQSSHSPNNESSSEVAVNRVIVEQPMVRDCAVSAQVGDNARSADIFTESDRVYRPVLGRKADAIPVINDNDEDACVENIMSLFDECECSVIDDSAVTEDVTVTNVQFDLHRFVADSDVSFHFVDLNVRDDDGTAVKVNSLFDSGTHIIT